VTILQRSPTYYFTGENRNLLADHLRELEVPEEWSTTSFAREPLHLHALTQLALEERSSPRRRSSIWCARAATGFSTWRRTSRRATCRAQRIRVPTRRDLFKSISDGQASIVTDEIEAFTSAA